MFERFYCFYYPYQGFRACPGFVFQKSDFITNGS